MKNIEITGARKHNLKHIDLSIPKRQLVTITGVSGSGKSTLAFDTIFQEGQRKYLESLSVYARQFMKSMEKPEADSIRGISPTISIDQKHSAYYYNSTVGTISEVNQYLRLLFARAGDAHCPGCGKEIKNYSSKRVAEYIFEQFNGKPVYILAPVVKHRKGIYKNLFEKYVKRGYMKALIDGEMHYLEEAPDLDRHRSHNIAIQVDAVKVKEENREQLEESTTLAAFESGGEIIVRQGDEEYFFSSKLYCPDCKISIKEPQPATFSLNSPIAVCRACNGRGTADEETGKPCDACEGSGFNEWPLSFYFRGKNIFQLGEMEVEDLLHFFHGIQLDGEEELLLASVMPQIVRRLESLVKLNLGYITLNRKINTLSGGELQRTRLVSQIGFSLSGIIYILDEPSIGMHMSEQQNLIGILRELKEKDNTVIVVEHDAMTIDSSDYVVDLGPGAGENGGEISFCGWYNDFRDAKESLTADYITGRKSIAVEKPYTFSPGSAGVVEIHGVSINNLEKVRVKVPLKALTVVTGVSGSGKSSLMMDGFFPIITAALEGNKVKNRRLKYGKIKGIEAIGKVMMVTQSAIGKNARSCPATYINIMPVIRELFSGLTESKIRGYAPSRFGFNVKGGRCEACGGMGVKKLEMSFLPDLEVPCPVCDGKRYNSETLRVKYNGLSIADVLNLTAAEAYKLFGSIPVLAKKLKVLLDVGLGYLKLGQSSVTLSGGESQRIKLTKELSKSASKPTVYLLDEPTVGLHFHDIQKLLDVFHGLVAKGHTVVVIEHNMEMVKAADHIIDLGPGGGKHGGKILYEGAPGGLAAVKNSITGKFLNV